MDVRTLLSRLNHTRNLLLGTIAVVLMAAAAVIFAFTGDTSRVEAVVVTHGTSSLPGVLNEAGAWRS